MKLILGITCLLILAGPVLAWEPPANLVVKTSVSTPKIANGTSSINVGSDSLIITPEGGIAVLMYSNADSTYFKGTPVIGDTLSTVSAAFKKGPYASGSPDGSLPVGVIYDDSIPKNTWGKIVVSGKAVVVVSSYGTIAPGQLLQLTTSRECVASLGPILGLTNYIGPLVSKKYRGVNANGDTLVMGIVNPFSTPEAP